MWDCYGRFGLGGVEEGWGYRKFEVVLRVSVHGKLRVGSLDQGDLEVENCCGGIGERRKAEWRP